MGSLYFGRCALGICAAAAILASCGGSQPNDECFEYGGSTRNALGGESSQRILPSDIHYCGREWSLFFLPSVYVLLGVGPVPVSAVLAERTLPQGRNYTHLPFGSHHLRLF